MEPVADLHIHTTYSDGAKSPEDILIRLENLGIKACAITDHDTVDGSVKAMSLQSKYSVEIISGIEISCHEQTKEYHLLGYNIDVNNDKLLTHLEKFRNGRRIRAEKILQRLKRERIEIELDYVEEIAGVAPITRPHIANAMIQNKHVNNWREAFLLYLGDGKPAYVEKPNYPISEAIKLVNHAGGIASLAHPGRTIGPDVLHRVINYGLDAIEMIHPSHDVAMKKYYQNIASQYCLMTTGGSDYHGTRDYDDFNLGKFTVPLSIIDSIRMYSH